MLWSLKKRRSWLQCYRTGTHHPLSCQPMLQIWDLAAADIPSSHTSCLLQASTHQSQRRCFLYLLRLWEHPLVWWAAIGMKGGPQPRKVSRRPVLALQKQLHSCHSLEEANMASVHMLSAFLSLWEGGQLMTFFSSLSKSINTLLHLDSST